MLTDSHPGAYQEEKVEIGLKVRWEEGRIETVQWSLDCTGRGLASPPVFPALIVLLTCPAAHCLLGEDLEHTVLGSAPLFTVV